MALIVSFTNNKGGVGKTSLTLHTLGVLSELGKRVLVVDLDDQGNLTNCLLQSPPAISAYELLTRDDVDPRHVPHPTTMANVAIIAGDKRMNRLDRTLGHGDEHRYRLRQALAEIAGDYDIVLIDCPSNMALATQNALAAADFVVIPVECHNWSAQGSAALLEEIQHSRTAGNPDIRCGFVVNKLDGRRTLERQYREILEGLAAKGHPLFKTQFPNHAPFAEAAAQRQPITQYKPQSPQATVAREFVAELLSYVQ